MALSVKDISCNPPAASCASNTCHTRTDRSSDACTSLVSFQDSSCRIVHSFSPATRQPGYQASLTR